MDLITESTGIKWSEYGTAFTVTVGDETLPSKSETPVARYRAGNSVIREGSALHCNFAGDDCWYVRVLPRIDEISPAFGSLAGGQELTISGWGLTGQAVVEVDGVPCAVQSSSATQIKCITGEKAEASVEGYQPG